MLRRLLLVVGPVALALFHAQSSAATCSAKRYVVTEPSGYQLPMQYPGTTGVNNCDPDNDGWTADGLLMTHSCTSGSQQVLTITQLAKTLPNTVKVTVPFPLQGGNPMVAMKASATVSGDDNVHDHIFWGGLELGTWIPTAKVFIYRMVLDNQDPLVVPDSARAVTTMTWYTGTVASNQRILDAGVASCGFGGNPDVSMRVFGTTYGLASASPTTASLSSMMDYYFVGGVGTFGSASITSIPGGADQTLRTQPTAVFAGTLCVYAGGQNLAGTIAHSEVSMLHMNNGLVNMKFSKWHMSVGRVFFGGAYAAYANVLVFGGGMLSNGMATDLVEIYDIGTNTTTVTCFPGGPRHHVTTTVNEERFVVFVGGIITARGVTPAILSNATETYDVKEKVWITHTQFLTSARHNVVIGSRRKPKGQIYSYEDDVLITALGGSGAVGPGNVIEQTDTFWSYSSGSLPEPRYFAGYASLPSTPVPSSTPSIFDGKMILASGLTTGSQFLSNWLALSPTKDPTLPASWDSYDFPPPQYQNDLAAAAARYHLHVVLFPSLNPPSYGSKTLFFSGGMQQNGWPSGREDRMYQLIRGGTYWESKATVASRQYDAAATCFTGTALNQLDVIGVTAFGWAPSTDGTSGLDVNTGLSVSRKIDGALYTPWQNPPPARAHVTGLGAGRYCIFAGGKSTATNAYFTNVNVYDAQGSMAWWSNSPDYVGGTIDTPGGASLSVARRWMATAFIPRGPFTSGYNGLAIFAGGEYSLGAVSNVIDVFDTTTTSWTRTTYTLSVARHSVSGIAVGSRYAVFAGGFTAGDVPSTVIDIFDANKNVMRTPKHPLNVARGHMGVGITMLGGTNNGNVYRVIFAGGVGSNSAAKKDVDVIQIYDAAPVT